jgi:hypothetical protein
MLNKIKNKEINIDNCPIINNSSDENCLKKDIDIDLSSEENTLTSYLDQYDVSITYEELSSNYSYSYNPYKEYYGASLIKIVDALYLIDNNINLDTDLKLSKTAKNLSSTCLDNYSSNSNISLRTLLYCALNKSDNGAHYDLINYIGINNLKQYALDLQSYLTISKEDYYGIQTSYNTNIYLKRLYYLLNNSNEANFLKNTMINNNENYLYLENINILHKYGYYENYYHDIGLVLDNYPYTISILTSLGKDNYQSIVNEIANKVYNLHESYWQEKKEYCNSLIYGD